MQIAGLAAVLGGVVVVIANVPLGTSDVAWATLLVEVVAFLGILVGANSFGDRVLSEGDWWRPGDVESGHLVGVPGDEFAELRESDRIERIRQRVIAALIDQHDCSRAVAVGHVDDGTWTDDRLAAHYLRPGSIRVPLGTRLAGRLRGETVEEQALRRTIAALRALRSGSSDQ